MTALLAIAKAAAVIAAVGVAWVAIDRAWRRVFPDRESSCGSCATCEKRCRKKQD